MRFFEFGGNSGVEVDRFVIVLRNYIGRAASQKAPAKLNWNGLNKVLAKYPTPAEPPVPI
jgi:hypothetical protein